MVQAAVQTPASAAEPQHSAARSHQPWLDDEPARKLATASVFGKHGVDAARIGVHGVFDVAEQLDEWIRPRRMLVFALASLFGAFGPYFGDWFFDSPPAGLIVGVFAFGVVVATMVLGWVARTRTVGIAHAITNSAQSFIDSMIDLQSAFSVGNGPYRVRVVSKVVIFLGVVAIAISNTVLLAAAVGSDAEWTENAKWMSALGGIVSCLGVAVWLGSWLMRSTGLVQLRIGGGPYPLPAVIDASDPVAVSLLAETCADPLLRELLNSLAVWRPRRMDVEKRYQLSLLRHWSATLQSDCELEPRLPDGRRADIAVSNVVLAEMKRRVESHAEADRAISQVADYARMWRERGPVLLIICDPELRYAQRVADAVTSMHAAGHAVSCVLVPPKGRKVVHG